MRRDIDQPNVGTALVAPSIDESRPVVHPDMLAIQPLPIAVSQFKAEVRRREAGLIREIEGQQGAVLATAAINAAIRKAHIADHRQVDISTAGLATDAEIQRVGVDAKGSLG